MVGFRINSHALITLGFSDGHNFTASPSTICYYGYRAYGEIARFTYRWMQKIKKAPFSLL